MTKKAISFSMRFLLFLLLLALASSVLALIALHFGEKPQQTQSPAEKREPTVILDAGHGGEDGGAVSSSGLYEKDLNLAIAKKVKILLEANGIKVIMTRETDILLYDRDVDFKGRKKALDLAARAKIGNDNPDALFVSIHMNAYPKSQYHGLQTWYSPNHEDSRLLAERIQNTVREHLQPENNRKIKEANSRIYLLEHLTIPAVLVECGFLSNDEEAKRLNSEKYQDQLAFLIFLAITEAREMMTA